MCVGVLLLETLYLLFEGAMIKTYKQTKWSIFVVLFSLISLVVSLYYKNYLGALCSLVVWLILSMIIFYANHITKPLFEFLLDIIFFFSILAAIYGLFEYTKILANFTDDFDVLIFNSPENRLNSVFFNANYYAMMIEFFVLIGIYKLFHCQAFQSIVYYLGVIVLNIFLLYLTGCRSAWPALACGILVLLLLERKYKSFFLILCVGLVALVFICLNPQYFPRASNILEYFGIRVDIWAVAIKGIKDNFLFGQGPMTYMHIYKNYADIYTQHAHSIYLDPLLSYGIVGVGVIAPYVYQQFKSLVQVYRSKVDQPLMALIIATIAVTLVHGLLDYTVYFVQTGFVFLMLISSFQIYRHKV